MTIKADYTEPCWEPVDVHTRVGHYHDDDRWPHFKSRAECAEAIAEIHRDRHEEYYAGLHEDPLHLVAAHCFAGPCVKIVCDGCGEEFDYEGDGGMHFDPADPMPIPITDCDWTIEPRFGAPDRHFCPSEECAGTWCHECNELHHVATPCPGVDADGPVPISEGQLAVDGAE